MEILSLILGSAFGCGGCFLPTILTLVALVDALRVGAGWSWYLIILGLPVVGPIAYFLVVRSPMLGGRSASLMSPSTARRLQAGRRLKAIQVQLNHWRGPGLLAEAGEELLVLRKNKEAEKHFLEAIQNGAALEDTHFGLAQALQAQGRFADAVPLLEKLVAAEPDARLGEGPLALARCLDESGRRAEAEPVLRRVLERRSVIEAQVRLARLLQEKGEKEEAGRLIADLLSEARVLPRYLKRRHGAWLRAARRLRPGKALPRPQVDGAISAGERLRTVLVVAGAVLGLLVIGTVLFTLGTANEQMEGAQHKMEENAKLRERLAALDSAHRWTRGDDLARVELTAADLDRYLRVRRGLEPALREIARRQAEYRRQLREGGGISQILTASSTIRRWQEAEAGFLSSFVTVLEREKMGPRELGNLVTLVEWRFLRRPEAVLFGLADYQRADWISAQRELSFKIPEGEGTDAEHWVREARRRRDRLQAKVDAMETQARSAVGLAPATQALLEQRRAEAAALDPKALRRIAHGLDESLGMENPWTE